MKFLVNVMACISFGLMVGCTEYSVERCVDAQINVAKENKENFEKPVMNFTPDGRPDFRASGHTRPRYTGETPLQAEARARLECMRAAYGKS